MRKPAKVVPITEAKRKPSTALEVPVPVEGAIRILTCHRTPAQISFSLELPHAFGEAPLPAKPNKGVEWRGASQLRALPEPDVNLSIHPAPIIGPLVSSSSVRTGRDCVVLPSATSPMSPWCGVGTVCIYELPIARETHRSCAAPPEASRGKTGHSSAPSL